MWEWDLMILVLVLNESFEIWLEDGGLGFG